MVAGDGPRLAAKPSLAFEGRARVVSPRMGCTPSLPDPRGAVGPVQAPALLLSGALSPEWRDIPHQSANIAPLIMRSPAPKGPRTRSDASDQEERLANAAASARLRTPSLARMLLTCTLTVFSLM
jgi:hypothetical protein